MLERYFSQCYIEANIEDCDLDLTTQLRKKAFLTYTKGGYLIESKIDDQTLFTYLINELKNDPKTKKYTNYYKLFCFDEEVEKKTLNGQARKISSKEAIILKNGLDKETIVHELFHCLGLYHSFSLKNKYTFEKYKTDNIMDYQKKNSSTSQESIVQNKTDTLENSLSIPRVATWQFQWCIIHRGLKTLHQLNEEKKNTRKKELMKKIYINKKTNSNEQAVISFFCNISDTK